MDLLFRGKKGVRFDMVRPFSGVCSFSPLGCYVLSSFTHTCHAISPKLMAPRMGTGTCRPDEPSRLYSALVSLIDLTTESFLLLILGSPNGWGSRG